MTLQEPGDLGYNDFHVSLFYLAIIDSDNVQNPNVTIALKNLAKKNSVTKEKRLGEFLKMLEKSSFDVKDYNILVSWLQLYPRLAIDSQKSVRHLAHQILATYMEKYGAKEFSKYLKTAMPIWLQGLFDDKSIANSVKSDLLKCFSGDESKVNYKIWVIFHEQIINYCHAVLVHESASSITDERSETADEVTMKYERALNSAISMLLQIIRLSNKHDYFISDSASVQVNEILALDQMWDNLGSCVSKENLNSALFRSYLSLISEIFSVENEGSLKPFTSNLSELKSVFKTVSKKFIRNVKLTPASEISSSIIYSSIIIPLLSALTSLTDFTNKTSLKIKKSFWQYGGLKSYSRLKDILKLGPCNSDPIYYASLKNLFAALNTSNIAPGKDFPFLDFSSSKDAKNVIQKLILPHFQKIRGYNTLAFKYEAIQCLTFLFGIFDQHISDGAELESLSQVLFVSLLDGISISRIRNDDIPIRDACVASLGKFFASYLALKQNDLPEELLTALGEKKQLEIKKVLLSSGYVEFSTAFYLTLKHSSPQSGDNFLHNLIEKLEEVYDVDPLVQGVSILLNALSSTESSEIIVEWSTSNLPGFISNEFVELPLNFLKKLLELDIELDFGQLVNDFFMKISAECPSYLTRLFEILGDSNVFKKTYIRESSPDAFNYLLVISRSKERLDLEDQMIISFIEDPEIYTNILESTVGSQKQKQLVLSIVKHNKFPKFDGQNSASIKGLIACALDNIQEEYSVKFLESFDEKNVIGDVFFEKLITLGPDQDFSALASVLSRNKEMFPLEKVEAKINEALDSVDLMSLSISNPLSQNINLIKQPEKISLSPFMLPISAFLRDFSNVSDLENISITILRNICSEYLIDYNFLASEDENEEIADLNRTIGVDMKSFQLSEADIASIFNGTNPNNEIGKLLGELSGKGLFTGKQYYISRILVRIFSPIFEVMSLSKFDSLEITYTKFSNHPLKLAVLLCSISKFIGVSSKLDRIRNFVFAEILGIRSTADICESGLVWLSLANSFIDIDIQYDILPSHKLGMLVNHLGSWLESDVAFDGLFMAMRSLLASFFTNFIQLLGDKVPDKTWELAVDLCLNSFGIAQINSNTTAMEYFTLKLFLGLSKYINTAIFDEWKQSRISIEEEVLGLTLAKESEKLQSRSCHQSTTLVYDLLERVLLSAKISKDVLAENVEKLYQMLAKSTVVGSQKIACTLLRRYIYESQQDAILEVQMRVSNVSGESEPVTDLTALNQDLLQTISRQDFYLDEALDEKKYGTIFRYLWSWVLVFDFFKESTYSMKADYIRQLKNIDSIGFLLATIFETLPLNEQVFLNQLVLEPIVKTDKVKPAQSLVHNYDFGQSFQGKLVKEEVYFLLTHLCYQTFQFLGSFALQWFNEVRDVQLKQQVEKFSVRFISPILISEMLGDVEKAKEKLTKADDTLTIKTNLVTNEIKSIYLIDEQIMEMVIKIPENFPLANVSVEGPVRLGVKENQWKAWLLASQRVITLTNGSIFDCIELFNKNVNLHFSGFEECAICYSILHQDHSLPSKNCPTCLNKFHAACLYKWFKSSGSSTCPLCRSAFNFNAVRS